MEHNTEDMVFPLHEKFSEEEVKNCHQLNNFTLFYLT